MKRLLVLAALLPLLVLAARPALAQEENTPPVIEAPDVAVTMGEPIEPFQVLVSDKDLGDSLVADITTLPPGLTYTTESMPGLLVLTVSGTIPMRDEGFTVSPAVRATDGVNSQVTTSFSLTAREGYIATRALFNEEIVSITDSTVRVRVTISEGDGDNSLRYSVIGPNSPSAICATFFPAQNPISRTIGGLIPNSIYNISVTTFPQLNCQGSSIDIWTSTFTTVTSGSTLISVPSAQEYIIGDTISPISVSASSWNFLSPSISVSGLPDGLSYSGGAISGTIASTNDAETVNIRIKASYASSPPGSVSRSFAFAMNDPIPPVIQSITASPASISFGQTSTLIPTITAGDTTIDDLTYSWSGSGSFSPADGRITTWTPPTATQSSQVFNLSLTATDERGLSDTSSVNVTLRNLPPTISNPGDKAYIQLEVIAPFSITVEDAEDTPSVTLSGLPSGLSYSNGEVSGTVSATATAQDYSVTITADDGINSAVTRDFTITINPLPAVSFSESTYTVTEGQTITVGVELDRIAANDASIPITLTDGPAEFVTEGDENLLISAGSTSTSFMVRATLDNNDISETLTLGIGALSADFVPGTLATASLNITDIVRDIEINFALSAYRVDEGNNVGIVILLDEATDRDLLIPITINRNTAESSDYSVSGLISGSLSILQGEQDGSFSIQTVNDADPDIESVIISFGSSLPAQVTAGSMDMTILTIIDASPAAIRRTPDTQIPVRRGLQASDFISTSSGVSPDITRFGCDDFADCLFDNSAQSLISIDGTGRFDLILKYVRGGGGFFGLNPSRQSSC